MRGQLVVVVVVLRHFNGTSLGQSSETRETIVLDAATPRVSSWVRLGTTRLLIALGQDIVQIDAKTRIVMATTSPVCPPAHYTYPIGIHTCGIFGRFMTSTSFFSFCLLSFVFIGAACIYLSGRIKINATIRMPMQGFMLDLRYDLKIHQNNYIFIEFEDYDGRLSVLSSSHNFWLILSMMILSTTHG